MLVRVFSGLILAGVLSSSLKAEVLYDGSVGSDLPNSLTWQWQFGAFSPTGASAVVTPPSAGAPYTTLDTSANQDISAGWARQTTFALDRSIGFVANWRTQIISSGIGDDRSGFSVIVLSSDNRGIEFGIGSSRIFAYNDDATFTPGEGVDIDLTAMLDYSLFAQGDAYELRIEGNLALSGSLRLYNQSVSPYNTPNFVFVGDDTSRQGSVTRFQYFAVQTVPEPATSAMIAMMLVGLHRRRRF